MLPSVWSNKIRNWSQHSITISYWDLCVLPDDIIFRSFDFQVCECLINFKAKTQITGISNRLSNQSYMPKFAAFF